MTLRVLDAVTRAPIEGAIVSFEAPITYYIGEVERCATNAKGEYTRKVVERLSATIYARGYITNRCACVAGTATVRLGRADKITLRIVDEYERPVPSAVVSPKSAPEIRFEANGAGVVFVQANDKLRVSGPGHAPVIVRAVSARVMLETGMEVHGRVVDSAGRPIAGVTVGIGAFWGDPVPFLETLTDAHGRFQRTGLDANHVKLELSKPGFASVELGTSPDTRDLEVVLFRPGSIDVEVVDREGRPVRYVRVFYGQGEAGNVFEEGRFAMSPTFSTGAIAPGIWRLCLESVVHRCDRVVTLREGERKPLTLVLSPVQEFASRVALRVLDAHGRPVAGAKVEPAFLDKWAAASSAVSDAAGHVLLSVSDPVGQWMHISVRPPEDATTAMAAASPRVQTTAAADGGEPVVVKLATAALLELEVVDPDGATIDGERLTCIVVSDARRISEPALRWYVDPKGATDVWVDVSLDGYAPRRVILGPGRHRVVLHPVRAITGRVVDDRGQPVAHVQVSLTGPARVPKSQRSDSRGRFQFKGLGAGTYRAQFERGGRIDARIDVPVPTDRDVALGDVVLPKPLRLRGRIVDEQGRPIGGASVQPLLPRFLGSSEPSTVSRHDGVFSFRVAAPTAHLEVDHENYGLLVVPVDESETVTLRSPGWIEVAEPSRFVRIGWPQRSGEVVWMGLFRWWKGPGFAPGPAVIELDAGHDIQQHKVTIVAGKTVHVRAR